MHNDCVKQVIQCNNNKGLCISNTGSNNKNKSKKFCNINKTYFVKEYINNTVNVCCDCSVSEAEADKAASVSEGKSVEHEGHNAIIQGKVQECAHYDSVDDLKLENIYRISHKNSRFGYSMGNECYVATQIIHKNEGEGQSMELVAENRFDNKVHSLGNCEHQDWKSNKLILSQNINDEKSLIIGDVSQFEFGDFKNVQHWDLENPVMDIGGIYGEMPQRLDT
jgi:hypothetical protein